jgi:nitroimidazol reductase NimA-like FMN-containing flavoprotein (pyridoxamine 5'-phosphate oxidase superfamily)
MACDLFPTNFRPPLPSTVLHVLSRSRFCYLATSEENSPHLCLMCYTFIEQLDLGSGCFIMSTKRATKKFTALTTNPRVAVLVHDFHSSELKNDESTDTSGLQPSSRHGTYSVTVYGVCEILSGDEADKMRAQHAERNPDYRQFIFGEDVAMISIKPETARICDINDNVQTWNSKSITST